MKLAFFLPTELNMQPQNERLSQRQNQRKKQPFNQSRNPSKTEVSCFSKSVRDDWNFQRSRSWKLQAAGRCN